VTWKKGSLGLLKKSLDPWDFVWSQTGKNIAVPLPLLPPLCHQRSALSLSFCGSFMSMKYGLELNQQVELSNVNARVLALTVSRSPAGVSGWVGNWGWGSKAE
jgi:hypothetical protein